MIIFVGDKPSSKNKDPKIPFVGTQSYKRLLEWIWQMNININDVKIVNKDQLFFDFKSAIKSVYFSENARFEYRISDCKFIALDDNSAKVLDALQVESVILSGFYLGEQTVQKYVYKLPYFKLPHPSGRNFKLNDKKFIDSKLKECETWLK